MAMLAAGNYLTSSTNLFQAVQHYEALSQFRIDLNAFLPDVNVLDRRRADLERQLEVNDDYRLRFLLGFTEHCCGLSEIGIENMSRAADQAPANRDFLRRFASDVKQRRATAEAESATRPAP